MNKPPPSMLQRCGDCGLNIVKFIPVIFLVVIIGWSYYAYVVALCIYTVPNTVEKVMYLIFYHPILIIFLWAYGTTILTSPKTAPREYYLTVTECEEFLMKDTDAEQNTYLENLVLSKRLNVQTRGLNNIIRFCRICYLIKPDRSHHCSTCNCCVLKMDHHCPWVNNCVGFHNYKFFVIFLIHGAFYCLYVAATSLKYFIGFWQLTAENVASELRKDYNSSNPSTKTPFSALPMYQFNILFVFFVAAMFFICLVGLGGYHIWLTCKNRTTLESFRSPIFVTGPDKNGFNLGRVQNFRSVFGDKALLWFLPLFTSRGDGVYWDLNMHSTPNYHTMENGQQKLVN